ncbi:Uncharacterised protein [Salmonella enterica subsp. indica]|uniref:Uncharacterized protein n=1 Tax=Salmonella enterica subsp. indica TaxID=59207 RepID=A0A379YMD1_SALER|nr:Uncharacterised protein [Salmonella enterica subsp. indica]
MKLPPETNFRDVAIILKLSLKIENQKIDSHPRKNYYLD